ncbi:GNAT family N-acetyltransferase [Clostridium hydrogenum]|uniref:GNAT family N-acetyltransferase n=1 Tax=Clostridium hydrogenum TaxID=2855764 RepID=UPI002E32168E|nr:GNAT family N-acetyltransferase [Clostridium hydrogenum]
MIIKQLCKKDIKLTAKFIESKNKYEESNVGYCSDTYEEICEDLIDELEEASHENPFILAYEEDKIVGVVGLDYDDENKSAEVWGPFVEYENWQYCAMEMWKELVKRIPKKTKFTFFYAAQNVNCIEFAEKLNTKNIDCYFIMELNKTSLKLNAYEDGCKELSNDFYEDFIKFHEYTFKNSYYTGKQIIEKMSDNNKVFIMQEANDLKGYIYVEANTEFKEGSINFLGVKASERNKGFGKKLLACGIKFLIRCHNIDKIELTIRKGNTRAMNLYKAAGFIIKKELKAYEGRNN